MSAREVAAKVREMAKADRITFSRHARQRMGERGFTVENVKYMLSHNTRAVASGETEWEIYGRDNDGNDTKVVVAIRHNIVVITVV
ncbi:MAG: DUF4258 domain-containing protein [Clostridia bacterium]|nr:DUF4258 domain-containing protein [Deltaproteobacteria bacterium]